MARASANEKTRRTRVVVFWGILLVLLLLVLEASAAVIAQLLAASRSQHLFWRPDLAVASASWARTHNIDEELGWPLPDMVTSGTRDQSGAKRNTDFPETSEPCLSAYGDSFVWGDDIPLQDGWIEQLSRLLGCRIANFGVSGYGTDQAFIRYRRTAHDKAPTVILGIFPDDIIRNVNQYRAFIGMDLEPYFVKGRFVQDSLHKLQWVPRPHLDGKTFLELHQKPSEFLPYEHFLPDSRDGPVAVRFPYTLTLLRFAMLPRIWNRLRDQTPWFDLYSPDHPSGAVPLTIAITHAFVQEAEQRGARVFTVMLPSPGSFRSWNRFGAPDYAAFVKAMADAGLSIFDPLPDMARALGGQSYCAIYVVESSCSGHFGIVGSALVAQVIASELRKRQLVAPRS